MWFLSMELLHVTFLVLRILRRFLDIWKVCVLLVMDFIYSENHITVSWSVLSCSAVHGYQHFGGICWAHFQVTFERILFLVVAVGFNSYCHLQKPLVPTKAPLCKNTKTFSWVIKW